VTERHPKRFRGGKVVLILCALSLSAPTAASGSERVVDGGFDASSCNPSGCTSQAWSQQQGVGIVGPICEAVVTKCGEYGSGYTTVPAWARLGYFTTSPYTDVFVSQPVAIPAAPALLAFSLRILQPLSSSCGNLIVTLDGTGLFYADCTTIGFFPNYERVFLDASSFAGPGMHLLKFDAATSLIFATIMSFDVDDVSLDAPDASSSPLPGPTDQRASALAQCKKKAKKKHWSKKRFKKCKRTANQLPV
jgi:hypothetical protein